MVITDLDAVDPENKKKVCRADTPGAVTSNATLKFYLDKSKVSDLNQLEAEDQILAEENCYVAFQKSTSVVGFGSEQSMHARTFEEAFVYENMQLFRDNKIESGIVIPNGQVIEDEYNTVFEMVKSSSFKKTEFALDVASSTADWITPQYIADGLRWLADTTDNDTEKEVGK